MEKGKGTHPSWSPGFRLTDRVTEPVVGSGCVEGETGAIGRSVRSVHILGPLNCVEGSPVHGPTAVSNYRRFVVGEGTSRDPCIVYPSRHCVV